MAEATLFNLTRCCQFGFLFSYWEAAGDTWQSVVDTPCSWGAYEALCLPGHPEATLAFHSGPCSAQAIWRLCSLVPPTYCPGHRASGVSALVHTALQTSSF